MSPKQIQTLLIFELFDLHDSAASKKQAPEPRTEPRKRTC